MEDAQLGEPRPGRSRHARGQSQNNSAFWLQCNRRERSYLIIRCCGHPEFLQDGSETQSSLHHGERTADANPRSAAERKVGHFRQIQFLLPPFRLESLRLWKVSGMPVSKPLADDDRGAAF